MIMDDCTEHMVRPKTLAHPQFLLPVTVVNPFRGFIRPALRANRVEAHKTF